MIPILGHLFLASENLLRKRKHHSTFYVCAVLAHIKMCTIAQAQAVLVFLPKLNVVGPREI